MGELCRAWRVEHDDRTVRRLSIPSSFDRGRTDVISDVKTRWSIGGSRVSGRRVPDIVRVRRYDVASSCVEDDGRKRSRKAQSSDLVVVPPKRLSQVCDGASEARWSVWNCTGLSWTWTGLRRRLSVLRRSSRVLSRRPASQPRSNTGKITSCHSLPVSQFEGQVSLKSPAFHPTSTNY